MFRTRLICALVALATVFVFSSPAESTDSETPPNIVLITSDDHGWPFYGFMQRYLREEIAHGNLVVDPSLGDGYGHPEVVLPDDHVRSSPVETCEDGDPDCVSCSGDDCTPPIDRLLTPAIDRLAEEGSFFPRAQTGAPICKPSFTSIMTGLHIGDYARNGAGNVLSPVLPEWLPGADELQLPFSPDTYLTMVGGKWAFGKTITTAANVLKNPWDRDYPRRNPEAAAKHREVLNSRRPGGPPLERVKEFIDCATCEDPSKCRLPPIERRADPDSRRLQERVLSCTPQPFFLQLSPSIPHLNPRTNRYCPLYPRDAAQCAESPYAEHSAYCQYDVAWDRNGNAMLDDDEYRTCDDVEDAFRNIGSNIAAEGGRNQEAASLSRNDRYYLWINLLDRAIDDLMVYLRERDLMENTVVMLITDNGFGVSSNSKGHFNTNGLTSPIVFYDGTMAAAAPTCDGGTAGCQRRFAHAVDLLATIRDVSGSTATCEDVTPGCSDCCPEPRGDNGSRYDAAVSLRDSSLRPCDFPADLVDPERSRIRQCMWGRKNRSGQNVGPGNSFYLMAEVADANDPANTQTCKVYRRGCVAEPRIYDLDIDPGEQRNLVDDDATVCGALTESLTNLLRHGIRQHGWLDCDA